MVSFSLEHAMNSTPSPRRRYRFARWFSPVKSRPCRRDAGSPRRRLSLELLENRDAPATFTVPNTGNNGTGSLRDAITQANATSAADTIVFDTSVFATPQTISLLTALPAIPSSGGALTITGPGASKLTIQPDVS